MSAPWQRVAAARPAAPERPDSDGDRPDGGSTTDHPASAVDPGGHPGSADAGAAPARSGADLSRDGDPEVPVEVSGLAAVVAALDELADLPVAEHVPRYDALHGRLSDALASIDGV